MTVVRLLMVLDSLVTPVQADPSAAVLDEAEAPAPVDRVQVHDPLHPRHQLAGRTSPSP